MVTGSTTRASVSTNGAEGTLLAENTSVSGDGRYVSFSSAAKQLVPGDYNSVTDVFLRDRVVPPAPGSWAPLTGGSYGHAGKPHVQAIGSILPGQPSTLTLSGAPPGAPVMLVLSASSLLVPILGGVLWPAAPVTAIPLVADASGQIALTAAWPPSAPSTSLFAQYAISDPGSLMADITLSNAVWGISN